MPLVVDLNTDPKGEKGKPLRTESPDSLYVRHQQEPSLPADGAVSLTERDVG